MTAVAVTVVIGFSFQMCDTVMWLRRELRYLRDTVMQSEKFVTAETRDHVT